MGGCCERQINPSDELLNLDNCSNEDILNGKDSLSKAELKYEIIKLIKTPEEIQLDIIIKSIQNIFKNKIKKISIIELYNLSIYLQDNYVESEYILYDSRRSVEQKEDFIKKMTHINYTYNQIKGITGKKLENFKNFLENKKIILIISEKYLQNEDSAKAVPLEIIKLLFQINKNLNIYILDSPLNEVEIPTIFIKLLSFLRDRAFEPLPYVIFCYRHVTTFFVDGYIFINFLDKKYFSFHSLINELSSEKKELSFENNFLKEMNIFNIINIDNSSQTEYQNNEIQYQNNIFKNINCTKLSLRKYKKEIIILCHWLRNEISKGNSIYINVEKYDETRNDWIFVFIVILRYIIRVNHIEIANYLKEKINFINNISENINKCLQSNEFDEIFK